MSLPDDADAQSAPIFDARGRLVPGLIAIGSALLALGGLWAWQSWSARSAPPVDDLLPLLVADDPAATPDATAGRQNVAVEAQTSGPAAVATQPADLAMDADAADLGAAADRADVGAPVVVHVSGAVSSPGVVVLGPGARVYEAVELAGGANPDADLDRVNLAAPVLDGERIHVPAIGDDSIPALVPSDRPFDAAARDDVATDPVIDINTATVDELESLPGVGPTIAQAIVQTRTDRGPFLSIDELLDVPGIGEMKLAQLRPFAIVG